MRFAPVPLIVREVCLLCNTRCKQPRHWPTHVARSCRQKKGYTSLIDAVDAALVTRRSLGGYAHVYLCPLVDHYHVTTKRRFLRRPA